MTTVEDTGIEESLGCWGEDRISGYRGIIESYTVYVSGCDRVAIRQRIGDDGKLPDAQWFDAHLVEVGDRVFTPTRNKLPPRLTATGSIGRGGSDNPPPRQDARR